MKIKGYQYYLSGESSEPLYIRISKGIKDYISLNKLKPGIKIPSEEEFCNIFGVSRITIRQAIKLLRQEGVLISIRPKGTFVADPLFERNYLKLISLTDEFKLIGLNLEAKLIEKKIVTFPQEIQKIPEIDKSEKFINIKRIRIIKNKPICLTNIFFPYSIFEDLENEDLAEQSIWAVIISKYYIKPEKAFREIYAKKANNFESDILKVKVGDSVLVRDTVYYTARMKFICFIHIVFNSKHYHLKLNLRI